MALRQITAGLIIIASFILFSCGSTRKAARNAVVLDTVSVSSRQLTDAYRATATRVWDITHTNVSLSFDLKEKTANGRATIDLQPYFYATDSLELDAKGMRIDTVLMDGRVLKYQHEDDRLKIKFDRSFTRQDKIKLLIIYKAMPYGAPTGGGTAIADDRGLYFINTDYSIPGKPAQIWTQGETESNSHWLPTIDKPNERFTFEITLTVPDSFETLSNGALVNQQKTGNHMRMDTWRMDQPIQPYVLMFAIGNFWHFIDNWRGKEVSYYVESKYTPYAHKMFEHTPEMMEHFSNITGVPYPWNKYSQVVVRDYVSGAMENTTATVHGEFVNKNARELLDDDNEGIVAHELFHQWFGDYVTAESWSNISLNESFANYGEYLWARYKHGQSEADELALTQLRRYLNGQSKNFDPPLARYQYADADAVFDLVSYQKGGAILHYLNELIGDSAFYRAMNIYLTKNALQPAEISQWRLAVEEATGQDWNWFFTQWYYRGGRPVLDIKYNYDDAAQKVDVTITQTQKEIYRLPVKSWVINSNDKTVVDWNMVNRVETFSYPYKNGQKPVVLVDAGHIIVGDVNYNLKPWQWLSIYKQSDDNIVNKLFAINEARKKPEDADAQAIIDLALKDKNPKVKEMMLGNFLLVKDNKWREKWKQDILYLAGHGDNHKVRALAFTVLDEWKVDPPKADILDALADSSYNLAGAALRALKRVDNDTAYNIAKKMLDDDPKGNLESEIWQVIGEKGSAADIALFEERGLHTYGTQKIDFSVSLGNYLKNVEDTTAFKKGLDLFVKLVNGESIKSYRSSIASYLFETALVYKERAGAGRNKAEKDAGKKLAQIKNAVDEVMKAEKNEANLKQYQGYKKRIFG